MIEQDSSKFNLNLEIYLANTYDQEMKKGENVNYLSDLKEEKPTKNVIEGSKKHSDHQVKIKILRLHSEDYKRLKQLNIFWAQFVLKLPK